MPFGFDEQTKKVLEKYGHKLDTQFNTNVMDESSKDKVFSREYKIFRDETLSISESFYERACNFAEQIIKISPRADEAAKIQDAIDWSHLNITPTGAYSLGTLTMLLLILAGFLVGAISFFLPGVEPQIMLAAIFIITGAIALKPISYYPLHLAMKHRLQASNQMVLCILYVVMYMRHTSNLEHAIKFAGEHIGDPLSLDLRKIVWDVETERYSNIILSLDLYLEKWKKYNLDFVESFNLIKSSLYEANENKRLELLEKSLEVMLQGTYERMLHYAQDVKSPITALHMLGVILPVLGLIMLPLIGSMLGVKWYQLAIIYNIVLPIGVYYMGYKIMAKRPVGYAQTNIYEHNPKYQRLRMYALGQGPNQILIEPKKVAIFVTVVIVLIGLIPLIVHAIAPDLDIPLSKSGLKFFDYRTIHSENKTTTVGPLGIGAAMLSLLITLGFAIGIGAYYKIRTNKLMSIREETKRLEHEFQSAIFQLGNRIGSGIPTEMAFNSVAETLQGTPTGNFFSIVDHNIRRLGMNTKAAIFDDKVGAINEYPSSLIDSSMRVLVETSQKGPNVVSKALMSISNYLDRINKVNERLKDLLAETVSSMKAQVSFLSPVISGIVVGIGTMITLILSGLKEALETNPDAVANSQIPVDMLNMFSLKDMMPPYFFQIVVGVYLIEVIIILSILSNGIENGVDKLNEEHRIGNNLFKGTIFYIIVSAITMIIFNMLAEMVKSGAIQGV